MNAYPAELIQHHYACMLVSGLLPTQAQIASPEVSKGKGTSSEVNGSLVLDEVKTTLSDIASDGAVSSQIASTSSQSVPRSATPSQAFPQISKELREIFSARGRHTAWDPSKSKSAVFHTVLVDNNVRLPPRKTRPTPRTLSATGAEQHPSLISLQPRSPLSPLHPSSPLFPDGLIAPIWLRKHRELVPSVFVSFYCLAEQALARGSEGIESLREVHGMALRVTSGAELKKLDEDLIGVISERKTALAERGIKFTVVLLTSRTMLESPTLESRLSYIRRSSQLDSKASLFVLTPVSRSELGEFVTSLQNALFESAQDYYREHYRRAKRKRSRYPPNTATVTHIMTVAGEIRGSPIRDAPLSKEGWLARNDYKMGTFAEFSSNLTEALQHYNNNYQNLANVLLASTMLLPPRTKRWAEAKVLSDCLNFKICKLHLYRNEGEAAWEQFKTHIKRFTELSQGWGIGEMTFEFWSWLGKQYRLMGDLLDLATKDIPGYPFATFQVPIHFPTIPISLLHPSHLPTPTVNGQFPPSNNLQHGNLIVPNESTLAVSIVPADFCQSAGACFYIAGICAMERWQRFRRSLKEEESNAKKNDENWSTLVQEKNVDHAGQAIEVFTRAHEVYKRFQLHRESLLVASKIAIAYAEGKQYEMALRFSERIAKSLASEGWYGQAQTLQLLSYQCSQITENMESKGRALFSVLSLRNPLHRAQRDAAMNDLRAWMTQAGPDSVSEEGKSITIESNATDGCFLVETAFAKEKMELDEKGSLYQLRISTPANRPLSGIYFDQLLVYFTGHLQPYIINHKEDKAVDGSSLTSLKDVYVGKEESDNCIGEADLRWWTPQGTTRAFQGLVVPNQTGQLEIEKICLRGEGACGVSLEMHLEQMPTEEDSEDINPCLLQPKWLITVKPLCFISLSHRPDHKGILVQRRTHRIEFKIKHMNEAYLNENFEINVTIRNNEKTDLQCYVEATILADTAEMSKDEIRVQDEAQSIIGGSKVPETSLGMVQPDSTMEKILILYCRQSLRSRKIEILLRSVMSNSMGTPGGQSREITETVSIPVKAIFASSFHANWRTIRDVSGLSSSILASRKPSITISDIDGEYEGSEGGSEMIISRSLDRDVSSLGTLASINLGLTVLAKEQIVINHVQMHLDKGSRHLRLADEMEDNEMIRTVGELCISGDRWGTVFDVEILSEKATGFPIEDEDGNLRPTGQLHVNWQRKEKNNIEKSLMHTSILDVPLLLPPMLLSRIVLSIPISTTLDQPLTMLLSVVNPARLPAEIFIAIDDQSSDFGVLSHKSFTVPLIAKSSRSIPVQVLAKSSKAGSNINSSIRLLPRIRAWQRDRRVKKDDVIVGGEVHQSASAVISPTSLIPIMNQHKGGGGLPLEVTLRYSKSGHIPNTQATNGDASNPITQLQAESQRSGGAWTIFSFSQADDHNANSGSISPQKR